MQVTLLTEYLDLAVPVDVAYSHGIEFERFPALIPGLLEVRKRSDGLMLWIFEAGGVTREFEVIVTDQRPNERVAWVAARDARQSGVIEFESLGERRCRLEVRVDFEPDSDVMYSATLADIQQLIKTGLREFGAFVEDSDSDQDNRPMSAFRNP